MTYFAGIDGGQSATVAAIADERGVVLGYGVGPPADLVGRERTSSRRAEALDAALDAALENAGLPADVPLAALVAGISGFDEADALVPKVRPRSAVTRIAHDAEIALAGSLDGNDGIVVIAGTGSVALGRAGETLVRAGGWGFLFGDEGSAFAIARTAVARAMVDEDRDVESELRRYALEHFGAGSLRAIQHGFAHGEIGRPALAAFARVVLGLASAGNADARAIRSAAAAALADLVCIVDERLGEAPLRRVSHAGGAFADAAFLDHWRRAVVEKVPHATVVHSVHTPELGALRLAYRLAGVEIGRIEPGARPLESGIP